MSKQDKMRILFVSHCFPPSPAAGAVRIRNIAFYLAKQGHSIDVVTVPAKYFKNATFNCESSTDPFFKRHEVDSCLRIATPLLNQGGSKVSRLTGGIMRKTIRYFGYEPESLWYWAARRYLSTLKPEDYDVILTSGRPWVNFYLVNELASKWSKPYVLDYRDLWVDKPQQLRKLPDRFRRDEEKILRQASGISVVSAGMKRCIANRIGDEQPISVIHNGYDPIEMGSVVPANFDHFTLVYAGTFYQPYRTIDPIFLALSRIKQNSLTNKQWQFRYYGTHSSYVNEKIAEYGLNDKAVAYDAIPRPDALSAMAGAGLNIVITAVAEHGTDAEKGIVTSKIFDAIGLGVPILLIAPMDSDAEDTLSGSRFGQTCRGNDHDGITRYLVKCIETESSDCIKSTAYSWDQLIVLFENALENAIVRFGNKPKVNEN